MPVMAQDAPRVIFCKGECFAVDARGIRTTAPKGTQLREGQRIETGPGAYVQLKLGPDAALGVSERARVRFDQRSFRDRNLVMLDQGRIRIVAGEAIGKLATRALELRTSDGTFTLRNVDIEVKKPDTAATGSSLTYMKLNAGDARLQSGPTGDIAIDKQGVQGITSGKLITGKPIPVTEIALAPAPTPAVPAAPAPVAPISSPPIITTFSPVLPSPTFSFAPIVPAGYGVPVAALTPLVQPKPVPTAPLTTTLIPTAPSRTFTLLHY
jgi:hypothetical protein